MPIRRALSTDDLRQFVEQMVGDLNITAHDSALGGSTAHSISEPLPLYSLKWDDNRSFLNPDDRRQYGWRSIVVGEDGVRLFADVEEADGAYNYSKLTRGPAVGAMIEAAALLEANRADVDAELRVIEAPSLKFSALWLAGTRNEFVPFRGYSMKILSEDAFVAVVGHLTRKTRNAFSEHGSVKTVHDASAHTDLASLRAKLHYQDD